ncbi:MmgE/PrpD family protein [Consotaella aegiceratis]|uniref:MmgE/PrpD family protein n=1 Tax=Consotaella aegiceratis TaxID=3097961 RepID=UPI002F3F194A
MDQHHMDHEHLLAEMVCGAAPDFSKAEMEKAARHFADLVGVAFAAAEEPSVGVLAALCRNASGASRSARIWGTRRRVSLREAGLINAYAAHWHDFDDDETDITMAHLTVTAMTAAAIVGDSEPGIAGAAVLRAYLTGTELATFIARLINPSHYVRGWHSTATLGTFAACAAAGRLLRLDVEAMRSALGMAASFAGGIRSNFGSHTKPLQVGQAVANGVFAAECAAAGLQSAAGSLLGPKGYVALQGGDLSRLKTAISSFGKPYGFSAGGMIIKAYPCCTAPHSAIRGVLELARENHVDAADIERIACHIDPGVFGILVYDRPKTPAQAKFSLPYALAAAAVFGRVGISQFTDAALEDPTVLQMMERVEAIHDCALPRGPSGISVASRVALVLRDGRRFETYCPAVPGSAGSPLNDSALLAKFAACAANLLSEAESKPLFELLLSCSSCNDFSGLVDAFSPSAAHSADAGAAQRSVERP